MLIRDLKYFDWASLLLIIIISCIGILFVFSATYTEQVPFSIFFKKQLFGLLSGFIIYWIFVIIDYNKLCRYGYFMYFIVIVLLVFTLLRGSIGLGAKRWIDLGLFKMQPSEFVKLLFPAYFTYYLEIQNSNAEYKLSDFYNIFFVLIVSCLLIRKQPDLGTAIIIFVSCILLMWLSGISRKFLIWSFIILIIFAPLGWRFLKEYQKQRIIVFLGGGSDKKERYQIEQSKIAIGSGGIMGKGFLNGTQNKLRFLPEGRTDFIFSVFSEEMGLFGALFLIILYTLLFARLIYNIIKINYFFAQILAVGLLSPIMLSTIINIGMVTGLLPIVGIPLPLMSYGISHTWVTLASFGWINGITMRRT